MSQWHRFKINHKSQYWQKHHSPKKAPKSPQQQAWQLLRNYGFERRVSLGGWIAEFLERKQKIAVALSDPRSERDRLDDQHTDAAIENAGYLMFRFRPDEINCLGPVILGNVEFKSYLARQR